jgi:hypothetical protein
MSITLVTQETMYHELAARALTETLKHITVDEVLTFSDKEILAGARNVQVDHFPSVNDYCEFMLRGMQEHVTTDHILFVQWDAMAHDASQWTDTFLRYDYIGAPWPWDGEGNNIGNGGFSLRSKRLLDQLQDPVIELGSTNEDQVIGQKYRTYLETKGIRYAPTPLAAQFSYELGDYAPSFGFHGPWNVVRFADIDTVDLYISKMNYQGWNIYKWHHLLEAITNRSLYSHVGHVVEQMGQHSPDLFDSVVQWLARDHSFWKQF